MGWPDALWPNRRPCTSGCKKPTLQHSTPAVARPDRATPGAGKLSADSAEGHATQSMHAGQACLLRAPGCDQATQAHTIVGMGRPVCLQTADTRQGLSRVAGSHAPGAASHTVLPHASTASAHPCACRHVITVKTNRQASHHYHNHHQGSTNSRTAPHSCHNHTCNRSMTSIRHAAPSMGVARHA